MFAVARARSLGGVSPSTLGTPSNPLTLKALSTALWPVLGGGLLAILLGRWGHRPERAPFGETVVAMVAPARRAAFPFGRMFEELDRMLRRWPVAGLTLLLLAILFGAAMLAGD